MRLGLFVWTRGSKTINKQNQQAIPIRANCCLALLLVTNLTIKFLLNNPTGSLKAISSGAHQLKFMLLSSYCRFWGQVNKRLTESQLIYQTECMCVCVLVRERKTDTEVHRDSLSNTHTHRRWPYLQSERTFNLRAKSAHRGVRKHRKSQTFSFAWFKCVHPLYMKKYSTLIQL